MSTVKTTDEALMRRYQNGDQEAFEELYRRYKTRIFSFLSRQRTSEESAAEMTQEVFIRVIRGGAAFRHGSRFSTWIYTIARNLAVDEARKAGHRSCTSLDRPQGENGQALHERLPGGGEGPDLTSDRARLRTDILQAIEALPAEQREVFLLREYHGLQFSEIAEVVHAKEGTVKSRMRYALEALRKALAHHADYARRLP